MEKVGFSVVGVQKSGTSALAKFMSTHPEIRLTVNKEGHFFDHNDYFTQGCPDYSSYHAMYESADEALYGDVTPSYIYLPYVPARMYQYNPSFKLIVLLRNPLDRAYSQWNMQRQRGIDTRSFIDAVRGEDEVLRPGMSVDSKRFAYVDRGYYTEQLRRLYHYFAPEQVMVLKQEALLEEHDSVLKTLFQFLGVNDEIIVPASVVHSREYVCDMDVDAKEYLLYLYEYEIKQLERMLGWDCSNWLL